MVAGGIDKIILPDELEDDKVILPDELEDDKVILPNELQDDKVMLPDELEDNRDYDPDDDTMDAEKDYGLYSNSDDEKPLELIDCGGYDDSENKSEGNDDNLLGKTDEDIDEEELAEVLDG